MVLAQAEASAADCRIAAHLARVHSYRAVAPIRLVLQFSAMGAVDRIKERWQRFKLRLSLARRIGRVNPGSPVVSTGTNAEILGYDDLLAERFDAARTAASSRLAEYESRTPQYPTASIRNMTALGFRRNTTARACVDLLSRSALQARPVVENLDGSMATGERANAIRSFLAAPSGINAVTGQPGPILWLDFARRFYNDLYHSGNGMFEWVPGAGTPDPVQMW